MAAVVFHISQHRGARAAEFRVQPYLQNPAADAVTVRWLSELNQPCCLTVEIPFPLMNADGTVTGWERRTYDDAVRISADD